MLTGKEGYHTLGLFLDTFSQHLWVTKFKMAGTAKTTIDSLKGILHNFSAPETFMTDRDHTLKTLPSKSFVHNGRAHTMLSQHMYSPWINGLVEGTNKLLLHVLQQLCAPNLGEDDQGTVVGNK